MLHKIFRPFTLVPRVCNIISGGGVGGEGEIHAYKIRVHVCELHMYTLQLAYLYQSVWHAQVGSWLFLCHVAFVDLLCTALSFK